MPITMNENVEDAPAASFLRVLFLEEFTCVAHTTMNENIYPQIPQIAQIIFSFSLRLCTSARGYLRRRHHAPGAPANE